MSDANLNYVGSITIDRNLLEKSGIEEYEKVQVVNITHGQRFETYVIEAESGAGAICLNDSCVRWAQVGDKLIVMSYYYIDKNISANYAPKLVFVNHDNKIIEIVETE